MVGSALVRRLAREGCEIQVADRRTLDLTRQADVEREAGRYGGSRKYGRSANLPPKGLPPSGEGAAAGDEDSASYGPTGRGRSDEGTRIRKPGLDEMGPGTDREVPLNFRERPAARSTQGLAGQKPKYKGGGGRRR